MITANFRICAQELMRRGHIEQQIKYACSELSWVPQMLLQRLSGLISENRWKNRIRHHYRIVWSFFYKYFGKDYFHLLYPFTPFRKYLEEYKPKQGDIIIDGGAFLGHFSLFASVLVGDKGKIIAFEPDRKNFMKLKENLKLNNVKNVVAINKGLWGENTTLEFDETSTSSSSLFFDKDRPSDQIKKVPVVRLDDELEKMGITKVNFIKLDVEGAEIEVIKSSEKTLKNNDVNLAIASYHTINGEKTAVKLEKILSKMGYKVKISPGPEIITYARRDR